MGRGKVQLKRIEDRNSRQVTFSKRKGGMMKKARELSVLCDVEVAFLIFSDRGRLYKFCSAERILTSFSGMQNQLMIETIKALQEEVVASFGAHVYAALHLVVSKSRTHIMEQEKVLRREMTGLGEEVEMAATRSENPESSHSRLLEMESNTYSEGDPPPAQQTILRLFNF